jgi:limonene-1,2-epoxide hydrolase
MIKSLSLTNELKISLNYAIIFMDTHSPKFFYPITEVPPMSPSRLSRLESAVRTVLAFNEAFNRHDVNTMLQLMSEDCVFENTAPAPDGTLYSGQESLAQYWQGFFSACPQARIHIEEIFGLGSRCIMRWRYEWEDESSQKGHVRGVDIFQVRDGLICEQLSYIKG